MCRISDLQDELRHRDHHIAELDKEILHLHENISALTKELEFKGKEILRIHSESNQQIRYVFFHSKFKPLLFHLPFYFKKKYCLQFKMYPLNQVMFHII